MNIFRIALFGACLAACGCSAEKEQAPSPSEGQSVLRLDDAQLKAAGVVVRKAALQQVDSGLEVLGQIAPDTDALVQVRPASSGVVDKVFVQVGDQVEKGAPLVGYAEENGSPKTVVSPQAGVVAGIYAAPGGRVQPALPAAALNDVSQLRCLLDIYEKDISSVSKGQQVLVSVPALPGRAFEGRISYISPRVDEFSRTVRASVILQNRSGLLKFGMFVKGLIKTGTRQALALPESALQSVDGKQAVFVTSDGHEFRPRAVEAERGFAGMILLKQGLRPGEQVAVSGGFLLKSELGKASLGEE